MGIGMEEFFVSDFTRDGLGATWAGFMGVRRKGGYRGSGKGKWRLYNLGVAVLEERGSND